MQKGEKNGIRGKTMAKGEGEKTTKGKGGICLLVSKLRLAGETSTEQLGWAAKKEARKTGKEVKEKK